MYYLISLIPFVVGCAAYHFLERERVVSNGLVYGWGSVLCCIFWLDGLELHHLIPLILVTLWRLTFGPALAEFWDREAGL